MKGSLLDRVRGEEGLSLIEVLMGTMLLAISLLGLAAAGGTAAQQLYYSRLEMSRWAVAQQQIETLVRMGYDNVNTDSAVVQGKNVWWEVTGTDPKEILIRVERKNFKQEMVEDTFSYRMAQPSGT